MSLTGQETGSQDFIDAYLQGVREQVVAEFSEIIPADNRWSAGLYELMLDYPLRGGKTLRPALCIAMCRALDGKLSAASRPAAILELYHNAFLVHDDVEDGSLQRRDKDTLHNMYGAPIAINVGDGMLAVCMEALLQNVELLGVGKTLNIFDVMSTMARETAEGQMMELQWIRGVDWAPGEREYVRMVHKKTGWYSFIAPMLVGQVAAGDSSLTRSIYGFASMLGVAFQIRDDLLNLAADSEGYGKEFEGDLWEGKHTLMLSHALRSATESERRQADQILAKDRRSRSDITLIEERLKGIVANGVVDAAALHVLAKEISRQSKTSDDVVFLRHLIDEYGGIDYATSVAARYAARARTQFQRISANWPDSSHREFLQAIVQYVVDRNR